MKTTITAFVSLCVVRSFHVLAAEVATLAPATTDAAFSVAIHVDAGKPLGDLKPIWRFFGADEPNYATMKDGEEAARRTRRAAAERRFLSRAQSALHRRRHARAQVGQHRHLHRRRATANPIYDWTILDRIFDTYLARGVRPYAQIGFMPEALSIKPEPYQHEWRPGASYGTHLHRLGLSAEGLREVGRTRLING